MRFNSKYHPKSQLIKGFLGQLETGVLGPLRNKGELLVLNYHSTPKKFLSNFEDQINWLHKHFTFLDPKDLDKFYKGELALDKSYVLLTFDDGLQNNLRSIELLNKKGIFALLFIVPDFIEGNEQQAYYRTNIRKLINSEIDHEKEDFEAISWDSLRKLLEAGNMIGCHTRSHQLEKVKTDQMTEIVESKKTIEDSLGIKVDTFCSPFSTLSSIDSNAAKLIKENYPFHFTTINGSNTQSSDTQFIHRVNVECFWSNGAFKFALGRIDRERYKEARKNYRLLLSSTKDKN